MKPLTLVVRILLGLMFIFFGLNNLFHFMPMPAQPPSDATTYATILAVSGIMRVVSILMLISGILLLVGRFVPLALTLLAPVLVNILLYHMFLEGGKGIGLGAFATVLELFLLFAYRRNFLSLFDAAPEIS